uniref:Uncharacterized protein n=1 Tax=viral metagenome TaxID=1070528 RepID=A0A6H1ZYP1_9ZZZZ
MTRNPGLEFVPAHMMASSAVYGFVRWLAAIPVGPVERKGVLLEWARDTGYELKRVDVLRALASPNPAIVIKEELRTLARDRVITAAQAKSIYRAVLEDRCKEYGVPVSHLVKRHKFTWS